MSFNTTVRPSSQRYNPGGWFDTSGNPNSVNDSNDSTYIVDFTGGASTIAWYCSAYSLAGNQRCAKATLNCRLVSDSPPLSFNMDCWIRPEGVMGDGGGGNVTSANSPTTFTFPSYNAEFSQAALNNLEIWCRDNFGGSTVADILDVWIDLEIHTQPTVTSVAPTGTGVGLNPTITWANNFQGDTQNANWIRIYRVSDNALVWDSGRVGVRTSQVVGPLATGTQYRAEVFAATDFYGDWWSNTASATFTTNFPPTVTVTAPTGTASSLTPTVTWTYSDTEGNAQNQYQVKIFNSAQYSIGGFDPETSPNTWDSTVTAGAATSRVVGTSLVAGTYRAYVKASDATAGFGAWSFSSFTMVQANMPGTGDLSAVGTSTAQAGASMAGLGDLTAFASIPNPCGAMGYGGGWYGGFTVYGGYGYCNAITPIAPPESNVISTVVDLNDSSGRLGCGEPSFFLTNRCASGVTCILDDIVTSSKWSRVLDDVSTAEVTVDLGGDTTFVCCQCLADTEPWCHELHIWRDGEEVWAGPVQEIEYSYNQVTIRASDSLAWLGVRVPRVHVNPLVDEDITTTAINAIQLAFNEELETYSCEVDNIFSEMTGIVIRLFYEAFHDTYLEILRKIASVGLNFTTIGRTIVLSGSVPALTPLVLLNDEHIIGDIKVTKDGTLMGNRYLVHFDGDSGVPTVAEATDLYCYNAIERVLDGLGLVTGAQAFDTATSYAAAGAIAPRMVVIPAGSRLSPDTPWTINQMVPGARVDVAVTRLCLDLTQSFILTGVDVSYSSGGEEVAITLTPIVDSPTQAGT